MASSLRPSFSSFRLQSPRLCHCHSLSTSNPSQRLSLFHHAVPRYHSFGMKSTRLLRHDGRSMRENGSKNFSQTATKENVLDWVKQDKFYTECLEMKLRRNHDMPEQRYANAFLGYGPEDHFVIELTYSKNLNYGIDKYEIGNGFDHFGIAVDNCTIVMMGYGPEDKNTVLESKNMIKEMLMLRWTQMHLVIKVVNDDSIQRMEDKREEVQEEQQEGNNVKVEAISSESEEEEGEKEKEEIGVNIDDASEGEGENENVQIKGQTTRTKDKEHRHFGNFRHYYERRNQDVPEDRRLEFMRKEWFEDKDILDIGCNCGKLTITIAQMFLCRSFLAVDIDHDLVKKAKKKLKKIVKEAKKILEGEKNPGESSSSVKEKDNNAEADSSKQNAEADSSKQNAEAASSKQNAEAASSKQNAEAASSNQNVEDVSSNEEKTPTEISLLEKIKLGHKLKFKQRNFVTCGLQRVEAFDTILCLSVTQWIHLNWGDQGIITLFARIWQLLRPGGVLVLEPQPWRCYVNKHNLSIVTTENYHKVQLYPELFQEILLDKIGFRTVEHLNPNWLGSSVRFNRPILVFKK